MSRFEVPDAPPPWDGTPRGPVTEDEALVVHRRSYHVGWQRRKAAQSGTEYNLPTELPSAESKRTMAAFRLDPRVLAFARTRAVVEGTDLTAVLDRLLAQFAAAPPGTWPTDWATPDSDAVLDPPLPGPTPPSP